MHVNPCLVTPLLIPSASTEVVQRKEGRHVVDWSEAYSAAYVPNALIVIPPHLRGQHLNKEQKKELREFHAKPLKDVLVDLRVPSTDQLITSLSEDIQDHVETRIQLFFQQLLLTYHSGKVYQLHETNQQIGSGKKASGQGGKGEKSCYAAAHSSTITNLKYTLETEDEDVTYPQKSRLVSDWNITVLLPVEVNEIDSLLDGKSHTNKLRQQALKILNFVADKNTPLNLKQGLQRYVTVLRQEIGNAKPKLNKDFNEPLKKHWQKNIAGVTSIAFDSWIQQQEAVTMKNKLVVKNAIKGRILGWYEKVAEIYEKKLAFGDRFFKTMCFALKHMDSSQETVRQMIFMGMDGTRLNDSDFEHVPRPVVGPSSGSSSSQPSLTVITTQHKNYCLTCRAVTTLVAYYFAQGEDAKFLPPIEQKVKEVVKETFKQGKAMSGDAATLITQHLLKELDPGRAVRMTPPAPLTNMSLKYKNLCVTSDSIKVLVARYFAENDKEAVKLRLANEVKVISKKNVRNASAIAEHLIYELRP